MADARAKPRADNLSFARARPQETKAGPWKAIIWWEIHRIIFNIILAVCGLISLVTIETIGGHYVKPGEDVVEPLLILIGVGIYAVAANVFYTLGWITEVIWSRGDTARTAPVRFKVFCAGVILSCLVTLAPAILIPLAWAVLGFKH